MNNYQSILASVTDPVCSRSNLCQLITHGQTYMATLDEPTIQQVEICEAVAGPDRDQWIKAENEEYVGERLPLALPCLSVYCG